MNEADWLSCSDPAAMLKWLHDSGKLSQRKARLFAVASCRTLSSPKLSETSLETLAVSERYADGLATDDELYGAYRAADGSAYGNFFWEPVGFLDGFTENLSAAYTALRDGLLSTGGHDPTQTALVRDLFLNPFRTPPTLNTAWLTPQVLALAQRAYDERQLPQGSLDPSLLAALADALEEGGCDDKDVLGHLREQGTVHVRGCWVVDLLLNKT